MLLGIPLLVGLLAVDRDDLAAYDECRSARESTTVWKVGVEDTWLRAGEAPESPRKGILHRGQPVTLLKVNQGAGIAFVRADENRKGFLPTGDLVKEVHPPWDTGSIEGCPQPFLGWPLSPLSTGTAVEDPGLGKREDSQAGRPAPSSAADNGAGPER